MMTPTVWKADAGAYNFGEKSISTRDSCCNLLESESSSIFDTIVGDVRFMEALAGGQWCCSGLSRLPRVSLGGAQAALHEETSSKDESRKEVLKHNLNYREKFMLKNHHVGGCECV